MIKTDLEKRLEQSVEQLIELAPASAWVRKCKSMYTEYHLLLPDAVVVLRGTSYPVLFVAAGSKEHFDILLSYEKLKRTVDAIRLYHYERDKEIAEAKRQNLARFYLDKITVVLRKLQTESSG